MLGEQVFEQNKERRDETTSKYPNNILVGSHMIYLRPLQRKASYKDFPIR
jgi:hypothetical protein